MCNATCVAFSAMSTVGLPILYGLMFLPSASGNLLSLWIFSRLNRRTSTHIYLINLAISNVFVTFGMPFHIHYYAYGLYVQYTSTECSIILQMVNILTHCSMCVSITIFCWIAISRYATLVRLEQTQDRPASTYEKIIFGRILKTFQNPKFAGYLCVCVWISYLCPTITLFLFTKTFDSNTCCSYGAEFGQEKISSITQSTCFFLFFFTVLLFYGFFIKHIKKLQANSCIDKKHLVHKKVQQNIVVIVLLLLVTFAPYHLMKFFLVGQYYSEGCQELRVLVEIKNCCLCLAEFRSCTDPIVYFCLDETFQKTARRLFEKGSAGKEEDSTANRLSSTQTTTVTGRIMHISTN